MNSLKRRVIQLMRCVPDVLNYETVLYIGASKKRCQFLELFDGASYKITLIEIWKENVDFWKSHTPSPPWNTRSQTVLQGDVRDVDQYVGKLKFDVVMWWHGPEHLPIEDLPETVSKLWDRTKEVLVLACPPGEYPQGNHPNPHEEHLSVPTAEFWDSIGEWNQDIESNNFMIWKKRMREDQDKFDPDCLPPSRSKG